MPEPHAPRAHPESIGPYHIVGELGEGGMGSVYRAEMREPVHRVVALKLIRTGLDSKTVLARFEHERSAARRCTDSGSARTRSPSTRA